MNMSKFTNRNVGFVLHKTSDGFGTKAMSRKVHLVWLLLPRCLRGEKVENGRRVEVHLLEDRRRLFVVNDSEVQRLELRVSIAVGVGKDIELVVGRSRVSMTTYLLADRTVYVW